MNIICPHCQKMFRHTRFKAKGSIEERFLHFVIKIPNGCWIWIGGQHPSGYGHFNNEGKTSYAHRCSWEIFKGPIPKGKHVLHSCRNRSCVNPDHLRPGTHQENMEEKVAQGRCRPVKSEDMWNTRLDCSQVSDMRQRFESGSVTPQELAAEKSMDVSGIYKILKYQYWKPRAA